MSAEIEPEEQAPQESTAPQSNWTGHLLVLVACALLLLPEAKFVKEVLRYRKLAADFVSYRPFTNEVRFSLFGGLANETGTDIHRLTAATAGLLCILALIAALLDVLPSRRETMERAAPPGDAGPNTARRAGERRSRLVPALLVSAFAILASPFFHAGLDRELRWTEIAEISVVALGSILAGLRGSADRVPRIPPLLLPMVLVLAAFLFGVADSAKRWDYASTYLDSPGKGNKPKKDELDGLRRELPVGSVIAADVALLVLVFGAWAWAAPPARDRRRAGPLVLGLVGATVMLSYAGLDRRLRSDLAVYTGGDGSNEDLVFYLQKYEPPPPPAPPPGYIP